MKHVLFLLVCIVSCGGSGPQSAEPHDLRSDPDASPNEAGSDPEAPPAESSAPTKTSDPECIRPSVELDPSGECGEGQCLQISGFPALSSDSRRLATITKIPFAIYGAGISTEHRIAFDLLDATGEAVASHELVTSGEVRHAIYGVLTMCCDFVDDSPCDDYLCAPDDQAVAAHNASIRQSLDERLTEVARALEGGTYCAMTPVPEEGRDGADESDLVVRYSEGNPDERGNIVAEVAIVERESGAVRGQATRPINCGQICAVNPTGWRNAASTVALVTLTGSDEESQRSVAAHIVMAL